MEECGEGKGMRGREDIIVYWTWVPIGNWTNPLRAEELFHLAGSLARKDCWRNLTVQFQVKSIDLTKEWNTSVI